MQDEYRNIYKSSRADAGLTQEQAAELLSCSVESIRAYETGQRTPPDEAVRLMADLYGAPWLLIEHARETDKLGLIPRSAGAKPFVLATIQLCNHMIAWAERQRARQLLRIAEDGIVDEEERPLYDEIAVELEGIAAAWLSLRCSGGTKKERPDSGLSKRSDFRGDHENHRMSIIHDSRGKTSPNFAGREVRSL